MSTYKRPRRTAVLATLALCLCFGLFSYRDAMAFEGCDVPRLIASNDVNLASPGTIFSYTVPSGRSAVIISLSSGLASAGGLPSSFDPPDWFIRRGSASIRLAGDQPSGLFPIVNRPIALEAGDRVEAVQPTSESAVADFAINVVECIFPDQDSDYVKDDQDNCLVEQNGPGQSPANQTDTDRDGYGNRCDPDYDQDNYVGASDFGIFLACFDDVSTDCAGIDTDGDGDVTAADFGVFLTFFGGPVGASGLGCADPEIDINASDAPCTAQ